MTYLVFFGFLLIVVLPYILICIFLSGKKRKLGALLITLFWGGVFSLVAAYTFSTPFRWAFNARFDQTHTHLGDLPLPPHTTRTFRFSETGVSYYTNESEEEITSYFKEMSDDHAIQKNNDPHHLVVTRNKTKYSVTIEKSLDPQGNLMRIDLDR